MSQVFLLQNQHKQFLSKQGQWNDGRDTGQLFRTVHRDEALNQMVEANSRDYTLRIKLLDCPTNDRGVPQIADEDLPPLDMVVEVVSDNLDANAEEEIEEQGELDSGSACVNEAAD